MITLSLNETEIADLQVLLDAGVRRIGLRAAMPAAVIGQKIAAAVEQAKAKNVVPMKDAAAG